jgi:hypothetical protein
VGKIAGLIFLDSLTGLAVGEHIDAPLHARSADGEMQCRVAERRDQPGDVQDSVAIDVVVVRVHALPDKGGDVAAELDPSRERIWNGWLRQLKADQIPSERLRPPTQPSPVILQLTEVHGGIVNATDAFARPVFERPIGEVRDDGQSPPNRCRVRDFDTLRNVSQPSPELNVQRHSAERSAVTVCSVAGPSEPLV